MSHLEKPANSSRFLKKPLEIGTKQEKSRPLELPQTSDATILTQFSVTASLQELPHSIVESVAPSKKKTSTDKSAISKESTRKGKSSKISEEDSTLKEKAFLPFWDKSCQELSVKLWSVTKTDLQGLVVTSSDGYVSRTIANSWFWVEQTYLQKKKWLKISLPSSTYSVADSTDSESTNLLSKKIRVYPETKLAAIWRTWISASRWCYNQAIATLKTQKIGKYDLRKQIMDTAPDWVSKQPYNPRQLAVFQAFEAHKAARKSGGFAKFRTFRDTSQTIRFQISNWKSKTFYPQATKGLSFKSAEPILEAMQHEPSLCLINGQWFVSYAVNENKPAATDSNLAVALDPGVRTFMTGFDGQEILEIGKYDIGPIYRLARHLDKIMSRIGQSKGRCLKRLRYCLRKAASKIRIKIKNLVSELHKKTAKYLCDKYKVIFLPTFKTQQMVKKGKRRLTTKTARAMVTVSHYKFKQTLKHQAAKYGCVVVDVTEEYTSKTCSKCGHIHTKLGGNKCFTCPSCGHKLHRDLNGAFNILLKALRDTSLTGILTDFQVLPYSVISDIRELPG
jgi:putative transposase